MATKRIYQIAKEFGREEKDLIAFLTGQGIKVGNRLSAVSEEAYEMLKTKFLAPPEPEPAPPEPEPEPVKEAAPVTTPPPQNDKPPAQDGGGKKKKKKNKQPQQTTNEPTTESFEFDEQPNVEGGRPGKTTSFIAYEANLAGNYFIANYNYGMTKAQVKASKPKLSPTSPPWAIIRELRVEYPDSTPMRYWQAVDKLATKTFKLLRAFGMDNRQGLAELRNVTNPIGKPFEPREIFSDEENQLFEEQRQLLFQTFGHSMGTVNDRLYELKRHAWDMRTKYENMDFVGYATNPNDALRCKERAPFAEMVDAVLSTARGVARRYYFYTKNKKHVAAVVTNFLEWIDGYAQLKTQKTVDDATLEKYLYLEKKFIAIVEFMSYDNLLEPNKKIGTPYEAAVGLLKDYRDNMNDPDAERNFKYKVRGICNIIYKPKEFVFLYQFADLEPQVDYRPPEEIAAAQAAKAAENKESPAEDEA